MSSHITNIFSYVSQFIVSFVSLNAFIVIHQINLTSKYYPFIFNIRVNSINYYVNRLLSLRTLLMGFGSALEYTINKYAGVEREHSSLFSFCSVFILRSIFLIFIYRSSRSASVAYIILNLEAFFFGGFQLSFFALTPKYSSITILSSDISGLFVYLIQSGLGCLWNTEFLKVLKLHCWICLLSTLISIVLWCLYLFWIYTLFSNTQDVTSRKKRSYFRTENLLKTISNRVISSVSLLDPLIEHLIPRGVYFSFDLQHVRTNLQKIKVFINSIDEFGSSIDPMYKLKSFLSDIGTFDDIDVIKGKAELEIERLEEQLSEIEDLQNIAPLLYEISKGLKIVKGLKAGEFEDIRIRIDPGQEGNILADIKDRVPKMKVVDMNETVKNRELGRIRYIISEISLLESNLNSLERLDLVKISTPQLKGPEKLGQMEKIGQLMSSMESKINSNFIVVYKEKIPNIIKGLNELKKLFENQQLEKEFFFNIDPNYCKSEGICKTVLESIRSRDKKTLEKIQEIILSVDTVLEPILGSVSDLSNISQNIQNIILRIQSELSYGRQGSSEENEQDLVEHEVQREERPGENIQSKGHFEHLGICISSYMMLIAGSCFKDFLYPSILPSSFFGVDSCNRINNIVYPLQIFGSFTIFIIDKSTDFNDWDGLLDFFWVFIIPEALVFLLSLVSIHSRNKIFKSLGRSKSAIIIMVAILIVSNGYLRAVGFVSISNYVQNRSGDFKGSIGVLISNNIFSIFFRYFFYKLSMGYKKTLIDNCYTYPDFRPKSEFSNTFWSWIVSTIKLGVIDIGNDFVLCC